MTFLELEKTFAALVMPVGLLWLLLLAIVLLAPAGLAGAWRPNAAAPAGSEHGS